MSKEINNYSEWILNYLSSGLFRCSTQNGCEVYHVLSPLLYQIGLFDSYKRYHNIILQESSDFFLKKSPPSILVIGIENEISAKFLIDILNSFEKPYSLTFIDRCETPLNRINSSLTVNEKFYIKTESLSIFSPLLSKRIEKQDIIFTDSFLKQFPIPIKSSAISQIKKLLKLPVSIIFFREYIGNEDELIRRLLLKLDKLTIRINEELLFNCDALNRFKKYTNELVDYYRNSGSIYKELAELKNDLQVNDLTIKNIYENYGFSDIVITANSQIIK